MNGITKIAIDAVNIESARILFSYCVTLSESDKKVLNTFDTEHLHCIQIMYYRFLLPN